MKKKPLKLVHMSFINKKRYMKIQNKINIIPKVYYSNAERYKFIMYKENKNKSGIYRWTNLITKESYIGKSFNITTRLYNYFSIKHLKTILSKKNNYIYNALLIYGHSNFSFEILEYTKCNKLKYKEKRYIGLLNPEYNILKES